MEIYKVTELAGGWFEIAETHYDMFGLQVNSRELAEEMAREANSLLRSNLRADYPLTELLVEEILNAVEEDALVEPKWDSVRWR